MHELSSMVDQFPYSGLLLLLILGAVGLPFPEDGTLILCGLLISREVIRPVPALVTVFVGLLLTDFFLYLLGRKYGHLVVHHMRFQRVLSPQRLVVLEEKFRRWGVVVVLVGRHLVGLRAQIFLAAGVVKIPPLTFLLADGISALLTIGLMVGAGYLGGNSLEVIQKDVERVGHVGVVAAVAALAAFVIVRHFRARRRVKSISRTRG
ncbi:MAG: DedA family protein [Chloroflexota bacterium]